MTFFRSAIALALCTLAAMSAAHAGAQQELTGRHFGEGFRTGIGYAGVLPDAAIGGSAWQLLTDRVGMFVDAKFTPSSLTGDADYCPPAATAPAAVTSCAVEPVHAHWRDFAVRDESEYLIFNAGAMYILTDEFALLLGAGMARHRRIREYFENIDWEQGEEPRISRFGRYYVPHEESPGFSPQLVVGGLFRIGSRVALRFGYETAPGGISIGGYLIAR